jgi:hypothetical protein
LKRVPLTVLLSLSVYFGLPPGAEAQEAEAQKAPRQGFQTAYVIQDSSFLPVRFYVGDIIELRMHLEAPGRELHPPLETPRGRWLVVNEVSCARIRESLWEVRIFFTTFRPGRHVLPDIDLGGVVLSGMRAETRSILEDKGEEKHAGHKGQLLLPGTVRSLVLAALALLLLPPLAFKLIKGGLAMFRSYRAHRVRKMPYTRFLNALNRLQRKMNESDPAVFFTLFSRSLREYISGRLSIPALTCTTLELQRLLPEALSREGEAVWTAPVSIDVIALLKNADFVRFGGRSASQEEMKDALVKVSRFAHGIEGANQHVES